MGPVRQEHERERRAVRADGVAALPEHPARRQAVGGVEERPVLGPRLRGEVRGGPALVAGVVVASPVRDEVALVLHDDEADRRGDRGEHRHRDQAHAVTRDAGWPIGRQRWELRRLDLHRHCFGGDVGGRRSRCGAGSRTARSLPVAADHPRDSGRDQPHQLRGTEAGEQVQHHHPEREEPQVPRRRLPEDLAQALPVPEHETGGDGDGGDDQRRAATEPDPGAQRDQRERIDEPVLGQEHPVEVVRLPDGDADRLVPHVGGVAEVRGERQEPERGEQHADHRDRGRRA